MNRRQNKLMLICGLIVMASQLGLAAPVTWEQNGHSYEVIVSGPISWSSAQAAAEAKGGYLVTTTSLDELEFVFNLAVATPGAWISSGEHVIGPWVGAIDVTGEGDWQWVTGEPMEIIHHPDCPEPSCRTEVNGDYLIFWGCGAPCPAYNDASGSYHSYVIEYEPPVASFKSLNVINLGDPEYEQTSEGYHMVGGVIRFDASKSYDPDPGGTIQSYQWDFAGGEFQRLPSPDEKPDVVFKEAKVYKITLVVVNDAGLPSEPYTENFDLTLQEGDLIFIRTAGETWPFDLVDNFYTHVGMYIGNQQMIESIVSSNDRSPTAGVVVTPLSGWAYPHETCAILVRLRVADSTIVPLAIHFALRKTGQEYDKKIFQKSLNKPDYYCSELLWAAYYRASKRDINLGKTQVKGPLKRQPVWPDHIMNTIDDYGDVIAHHREFCPVYPPDYKPPHWNW